MPEQQNAASKHSTKIFSLFISALYNLLNSTHKCNLSVRPFVMVAKLAKKYSRGVGKPSFLLVHLVSVSLSLLLSMTLPPFHQARITDTYRLLCHLWQAMLSYASCRLLYRIQRWSFFSLEQEREFPSLALSFRFGFSHLYELNLGNNKKAAGNNACGFAAFAVFLLTAYSTINFFVTLPSMTV